MEYARRTSVTVSQTDEKLAGHSRPACQLIARMAQIRPVTITYFVPKTLYRRLETELSRCFEEEDMHYKDRIR